MNIQDLKSNTTWQEASNTINNNNNKISLAIATLENATLKNKGYFTTLEKLNEAIPNPTIGSKAYVGTSEPYAIYIVENGAWVDSGYTGGDEIVANITTDRIEDGAVTSEKIATSAFDPNLSVYVSGKIAPAEVVGYKFTNLESTTRLHSNAISKINAKLDEHTESINSKITTDRIEDGAVTTEKIATSAFDSTLSVSGKIAPADVVGTKLTELESEIYEISKGKIDYHNEVYFAEFASLGMVNADGSFRDSSNFLRYVIHNNEYLNVSCRFYTNGPEKMAIAFYNGEPSVDTFMSDKSIPWDATVDYHDYYAEVPNGCKYIAICSYFGDSSKRDLSIEIAYKSTSILDDINKSIQENTNRIATSETNIEKCEKGLSSLKESQETLDTKVTALSEDVKDLLSTKTKTESDFSSEYGIVYADGRITTGGTSNLRRYIIPNDDFIDVYCKMYTNGPEKCAIAFYNDEPSVDTFMVDDSVIWANTIDVHTYQAIVPAGCKYICICHYVGIPQYSSIEIKISQKVPKIDTILEEVRHDEKELTMPYDILSSNYPWKSMTVYGSSKNISDVASYLEGNYNACFKTYIETSSILDNKAGDYFGYRGNCAKIVSESGIQLLLFHHIADNGNDISNIKYRVYVELYADSNVASMYLHKRTSGDTQPTDITLTDSPFKGFKSFEVDINGSDIVKHATYGYNIVVKINSNQANIIRVGRFCVIVDNDEKDKRTLPVPIVQLDTHYLDGLRFGYLSSFFGKKLYTIGDSIVHQNTWQSELAKLKGLEYDAFISTESCEHPLGIGGSTICPLVRVTTDNTGDKNKALSRTGEQLRDSNGNLLWFVIGQAPNQSIYYRADYFASYYSDAGVAVIHGGENDSLTSAYSDLGNAEDAPYQGLQYVLPQYAVIAEHYDNVAILNDGSYYLDAKYLSGGYTIITQRPSFASCLAGVIRKILISCPTARLIGCSIQRRCDTLANQAETRVARYNIQREVYEEYSIPFADFWNKQGTNKWTEYLYKPNDGIHPSALGGIRMASILANLI